MGDKTYDIIIVTPFYKRKKIFKLFLNNLRNLKEGGINLHAILIGSETIENEKELVKSYGFEYTYFKNNPLSNKWNHGISLLKEYNFNYLVIMGSDVLVNFELLNRINELSKKKEYDIYGILDGYVYNYGEKIGVHWPGYSKKSKRFNEPTGSCRFYSKKFLEDYDYILYRYEINKGLDASATLKFKKYKVYTTKMLNGEYLISLKSNGNDITEFKKFKKYPKIKNIDKVVNSILKKEDVCLYINNQ